ncbi:MAG TPA: bifunctional DNA-binding transcriptional regulator/O6-methylguanine-DNA methyltransferase Ada [Gemmatimonadaceae bacterium]|nr:bifunctional DNA-binding transcriptional regulator/O6-methylguanine-DNA methyltransferase Ada [Gemmatimonadaceae bacterium]
MSSITANATAAAVDAERAWDAVHARDAQWDRRFVYAVRTTGIYCRPSCASRRPRREHVTFFPTADDAERAGFRACRRCRPRETHATRGDASVAQAIAYLDAHRGERVTLRVLARAVGLSPYHLQRAFTRVVGISPHAYVQSQRVRAFRQAARTGATVTNAAFDAGYESPSALYAQAAASLGMTPSTYRRGGAGATIIYRIDRVALGHCLVAATERGVAMVALDDTVEALEHALRAEFPAARLVRAASATPRARTHVERWARAVHAAMDASAHDHALRRVPVDVPGTAFQRRVWEALRAVPRGTTVSYRALAEAIGAPRAARAVARACATNPAAVVIPCHRVVRGDGRAGGYRWGVARKERLLANEGARSEPVS